MFTQHVIPGQADAAIPHHSRIPGMPCGLLPAGATAVPMNSMEQESMQQTRWEADAGSSGMITVPPVRDTAIVTVQKLHIIHTKDGEAGHPGLILPIPHPVQEM